MKYPVAFPDHPELQAFYVTVRKKLRKNARKTGKSFDDVSDHRFAEMLTLRQVPRTMTDRELYEGLGTLDKQFRKDPDGLKRVVANAKRHGYNPNPNDVYMPTLAKFEGDPKAFISEGRHQIAKTLKQRNQSGYGVVNHERDIDRDRQKDPLKDVTLAPDITMEFAAKEAKKNGGKIPVERVKEISKQYTYKM